LDAREESGEQRRDEEEKQVGRGSQGMKVK
jgi:hypothetical protein